MTHNTDGKIILHPNDVENFTRRNLIKSGLSLAAYVSLEKIFGMAHAQAPTKKLVWIHLRGGVDILECMDPKPSSNDKLNVPYNWSETHNLAGANDDIRMGRWMPGLAQLGSNIVLVRGLAMGTTSHDAGTTYMDTGVLSNNGQVNAASIPSIVAATSAASIPIIQLAGGLEPKLDRGIASNVSVVRAENLDLYRSMYPTDPAQVANRVRALDYLKASVAKLKISSGTNDRLVGLESAEQKIRGQFQANIASQLKVVDSDRAIFRSGGPELTRRWGELYDNFALTLKLIKNDIVTCVNLGVSGFDTHSNQDRALNPILTGLDFGLKTFVQELTRIGKLDDTLIVVVTDFGRTPKVNSSNGRDHWPIGGAIMIGGGIAGGRAVGATDANLLAQSVDKETGLPSPGGEQLNATHLGGAVLNLTIGPSAEQTRPYLKAIPALVRKKSA